MSSVRALKKPSIWRLGLNTSLCLVLCVTGGGVYTFSLYSQALRFQMGFSQLDNQYIYNFGLMGYSIGCLMTGTMLKRYGHAITLGIACVSSVSGYALSALAVAGRFSASAELMWVLMMLASYGQGLGYITGLVTNTRNFVMESRGKIVGFTMASFSLSPLLFSAIWEAGFMFGDPADYSADSQRVSDYFWFLTIFVGTVTFLGTLLVRQWDADVLEILSPEEDDALLKSPIQGVSGSSNGSKSAHGEFSPPFWSLLKTASYLSILAMFCVFKGVDKTYLGDLGKIGQSLKLDHIVSNQLMISGATSCVARIISGVCLDQFRERVPNWIFIEIGLAIVLLMDILLVFLLFPMYEYYLGTIGYACAAIVYAVTPAIIAIRYGKENMANLWSICASLSTGATFAYGGWNSLIYESHVNDGDDGICFGVECYTICFVIAGATVLCAMLLVALIGRDDQHEAAFKMFTMSVSEISDDEDTAQKKGSNKCLCC